MKKSQYRTMYNVNDLQRVRKIKVYYDTKYHCAYSRFQVLCSLYTHVCTLYVLRMRDNLIWG